jgi:hypothetical protein
MEEFRPVLDTSLHKRMVFVTVQSGKCEKFSRCTVQGYCTLHYRRGWCLLKISKIYT